MSQIHELTLPTDNGDKSLQYELEAKQATALEQTIDNLKSQKEIQNNIITQVKQPYQLIKKWINIRATDDTSNDAEASSRNGPFDEDTAKITNFISQPIMKVLGDLFSREDKKINHSLQRKQYQQTDNRMV